MIVVTGTAALVVAPVTSSLATTAAPTTPPAYTQVSTANLNGGLLSDIAGSAFVDRAGQFHWTNAYAGYADDPSQGWAHTFTNTNLATVNAGYGSSTTEVTGDAFYATPGSVCYQVDKAKQFAIPSPQEDDHCDVIGVWVDPATGTWHALLNDEYQFDPWGVAGSTATVAQKISTGLHNDRVLLATSNDEGASWQYAGPALTSAWDHDGVVDSISSPGTTYPFGDSGPRLFVDYSSGYFYITYNVKIYRKPGASTVASWTEMARAPISGRMASGSWTKYYDGSWSQPGVGGIDGAVGGLPGMNVSYDPATDVVSFQGTDANGQAVDVQANTVAGDHLLPFADAAGNTYTANTLSHQITDAAGTVVPQVDYTDPITGDDVEVIGKNDVYSGGVKVTEGGIFATWTDPTTGATRTVQYNTGSSFWEDAKTQLLYDPRIANEESAVSYDAYTEQYRLVGYDGNVYETANLGDPTSWQLVGTMPANSYGGYLTTLDDGSLTNQNVTGSSFLTVSDLSGLVTDVAMTAPSGQQLSDQQRVPVDSAGVEVDGSASYTLTIGGKRLSRNGKTGAPVQWRLVPVANADGSGDSGFYRLQNVQDNSYLQLAGSTAVAQRAMGASATDGPVRPDPGYSAGSALGTAGGSDEWYVQVVAAAGSTSLAGSTTYRLVNRNSGLALEFQRGRFRLVQQRPGDPGQYLTFTAGRPCGSGSPGANSGTGR